MTDPRRATTPACKPEARDEGRVDPSVAECPMGWPNPDAPAIVCGQCVDCIDRFPPAHLADMPFRPSACFMVVCAICGNKRCPHSDHHENACTGSNEPGQPGSRYRPPPSTPRPDPLSSEPRKDPT